MGKRGWGSMTDLLLKHVHEAEAYLEAAAGEAAAEVMVRTAPVPELEEAQG